MRTLRFFFSFVMLILLLGAIGFLAGRELFLLKAASDLQNMVGRMERIDRNRGDYEFQCRKKGGSLTANNIRNIQLRFTDSQKYVVEVICEYFSSDPIIAHRGELPPYVYKQPGQSGLIWNVDGRSGLVLEMMGSYRTVILDGPDFQLRRGAQKVEGNKPISACMGFGYRCCDAITEIGEGQVYSEVTDCHDQCYLSCKPRPVVLKFSSDPSVDYRTGSLTINSGQEVTFYYVVDPGSATKITHRIQFGDGNQKEFTELDGFVTHTYECPVGQCNYIATVQSEDELGTKSIVTPISTIDVRVQALQ